MNCMARVFQYSCSALTERFLVHWFLLVMSASIPSMTLWSRAQAEEIQEARRSAKLQRGGEAVRGTVIDAGGHSIETEKKRANFLNPALPTPYIPPVVSHVDRSSCLSRRPAD